MFLLTLLCPFSVVAWSIVENKNRSSPIPGVLLPRFLVQLNDSESLSDVDRTLAFLEWSKRSIDTAVSEERGSAGETQKDSICYPGPKTVNSRHIFYCDQLSRANETVSEAQDFFIQLANSTQSLVTASVPIASQFSWHLKEVESLREKLSTAEGQLGTSLEHTYNLATDILSNLTTLEIAALNTKIAESRPSHDPPMGIFNGTRSSKWPSPPNNFTKLPPIPSRPPPIFNGTSGDRPRPRRPCRFNSSKVDRLLNGTDVRDDMAAQLLITTNTTDEDEDLCDDMPNMKHDRRFQVCNRSFWQQDFTKNQLFKKVQSLLGNQVSIIEKFVHFAKNSSTTDANFTMECEKFLNSTNLRQLMGMFTTGNHSMSSIVSSLTGSGLLSNSSSISSLLTEFQQSGNNGSQLSGILNGLSTTNITTLLSANNGSVSSSLSNIVSQLPSKIDSLKTAFLNNFGPNIPSIGQFLKGIVV